MSRDPRFLVTLPTREERRWAGYGVAEQRAQLVRAAEIAGLDGVVAPYDVHGEDSLVAAADALRHTRWLEVVQEFHPFSLNPVYAAKVAASTQRFTQARLGWQLAVDAPVLSQPTPAADTPAERYARAAEFLTVARGVWENPDFTFEGVYHTVVNGGFREALAGLPFPRLHLTGTSDEALRLSAEHADVHVFTDPATITEGARRLRSLTDRPLQIALATTITVREHAEELRDAAPDPGGLSGTYDDVAGLITELSHDVDAFVLTAHPRIEETYRIGEHLLPLVRATATAGAR